MPNRLRLALVGAGPVAQRYHMRAIRGVPEVLPAVVLDLDENRARQFAQRQGFLRYTTRLEDLLGAVDLAIVALPNGAHASVSCELLTNGVHVLCEKPMARTVPECRTMIEAAERGGTKLCIGHNRRFRTNVMLAKRWMGKGIVGEVTRIEAEEGSTADWARSPIYFDPQQAGGGALIDVGIHSIDLIRWLAGEFQDISYRGNETAGTVESDAELRFRLATGAEGTLVASRTRNLQQHIYITGTEGFIDIGLWSEHLRVRHNKGKAFQKLPHLDAYVSKRPPQDPSFVLQLTNFVNAIRGTEKVLVDGYEGMANVDVVTRAYARGFASPAGQGHTVAPAMSSAATQNRGEH
jgi:UDP-N-acetylglucosamine 3-dehydrogenase